MIEPAENRPLMRFLRACERSVRVWSWLLVAAVVLALVGLVPSLIGILAVLGVVWVPILVLIFWGRMLDEMVFLRTDRDEGPW